MLVQQVMSHVWKFSPEEEISGTPRKTKVHSLKRKEREWAWVAPEHSKVARSMNRDYPRDDWGRPIRECGRELKIDSRPSVMVPPRPTYLGFK